MELDPNHREGGHGAARRLATSRLLLLLCVCLGGLSGGTRRHHVAPVLSVPAGRHHRLSDRAPRMRGTSRDGGICQCSHPSRQFGAGPGGSLL